MGAMAELLMGSRQRTREVAGGENYSWVQAEVWSAYRGCKTS
jgi:hypothetical protein